MNKTTLVGPTLEDNPVLLTETEYSNRLHVPVTRRVAQCARVRSQTIQIPGGNRLCRILSHLLPEVRDIQVFVRVDLMMPFRKSLVLGHRSNR